MGEIACQKKLDVRARIEPQGRRFIRDYLPKERGLFYAQLPVFVLGTVDPQGRLWATLLSAAPGFLSTPRAPSPYMRQRPVRPC